MLNIVLFEPEIPQNTGNIGRTCVATNTRLHLIEPLGFRLDEKSLRRAGMDYWKDLDVTTYRDFDDFMSKNPLAKGNIFNSYLLFLIPRPHCAEKLASVHRHSTVFNII